jgi:DNA-binding transcriptional LysR family regulator
MELRHLRYFVAAAEEEHFGRAAERLNVSGPAVGQQIRELEEELGVQLFERLPRGVRLTVAGTALLGDVRRVLADLHAVVEHAQELGRGSIGILRVAHIPMSMMRGRWVGQIVPTFCLRHPRVEVRSTELSTADQCSALDEGRIDVGIAYAAPEAARGLRAELLYETPLDGALLPAAHPLAHKSHLKCADLAGLRLLQTPPRENPHGHAMVLRELRARGLEAQSDAEHQISDPALRINLIAAGAGWMPASAATARGLLAGVEGVVFRKWADPPIPYPAFLLWRADGETALVQNFLAVCRELRDRSGGELPNRAGVA